VVRFGMLRAPWAAIGGKLARGPGGFRGRRVPVAALREAEARFQRAFDSAPIGMALVSVEGSCLQVNQALCEITGYQRGELVALNLRDITYVDDQGEDVEQMSRLMSGEISSYQIEKRYVRASGEVMWGLLSVSIVRAEEGEPQHLVYHVQDITERRRFESDLSHLAHHDPLTGLFNRRRFEVELNRQVLASERLGIPGALLMLDLDNFKYINDTLGHAAGDELVGRVAQALLRRLRRTDVLARLGGDEFAVILPGVELEGAQELAESLLEIIQRDCVVLGGGRAMQVSASIGLAPIDAGTPRTTEQLLIDADLAMYGAKTAGRARVSVRNPDDSVEADLHETLTWAERVRTALKEDRFVLYEQPIEHLGRGEIARHEILLRMIGDEGEHIPPMEFLPVAERFGLVQAIDAWVVRHSIALIAEQARVGNELQLEVNISGASVTDPELLVTIEDEIAAQDINPGSLIFEITETAAIVNIPRARRFAERLAELGCRFALDDFGAGFGGFFYLKHLPFDTLKIDGEFVRGLASSPRDQAMVKAIAQVAAELGTQTVAEFVGDEQTRELLRSYGVDYAQGYHIGKPRPVAETWPAPALATVNATTANVVRAPAAARAATA
jgi:diguanylate cyclase (GGDEF)-like protein/PAS domain S-box-containing protein